MKYGRYQSENEIKMALSIILVIHPLTEFYSMSRTVNYKRDFRGHLVNSRVPLKVKPIKFLLIYLFNVNYNLRLLIEAKGK